MNLGCMVWDGVHSGCSLRLNGLKALTVPNSDFAAPLASG